VNERMFYVAFNALY